MIGRLTGKVLAEEADGTVVVDVGGVGYEVTVPLGTLGRADADDAGRAIFFVHTHVREDTLSLFGFASDADHLAFRTLISVSNVGPKTAIAVLSALPASELARAIALKDMGKLTGISGIGKKTAERLILELRDKLPQGADVSPARPVAPPARKEPKRPVELLIGALTNMGYRAQEAERAAAALEDRVEAGAPISDLLREALAILAK